MTLPRAVIGTAPRAYTGKPTSRLSSMSRQAPSTTTPLMPFVFAAKESSPPQQELSGRPPLSMTIVSPGSAATIAAVPRCRFGFSKPAGLIFIVTARPTIFGQGHMGRTPWVAPFNPKRSIPSDTAQVSSFNKRSTIASRAIRFSFVASAKTSCASRIATQGLKPETQNLKPTSNTRIPCRNPCRPASDTWSHTAEI
jgi:hypothetical protein